MCYPDVETGGILVGNYYGGLWLVHEIILAGATCVRTPQHFSVEADVVSERVQAVLNRKPAYKVLGLWHKHNHDMSPFFSSDDIGTSNSYAKINSFGILSILAAKGESIYTLHAYRFCRGEQPYTETIIGKKHLPVL